MDSITITKRGTVIIADAIRRPTSTPPERAKVTITQTVSGKKWYPIPMFPLVDVLGAGDENFPPKMGLSCGTASFLGSCPSLEHLAHRVPSTGTTTS
jgi:hypothetical protein